MKELKPEHIAAYLPYGVKITKGEDRLVSEIMGISIGRDSSYFNVHYKKPFKSGDSYFLASSTIIKLILHPFSDLTKPITVESYNEGKEFVPMLELLRIEPEYPLLIEEDGNIYFTDACNLNMLEISRINKLFQLLYRWHFAVDIPEGCWIDINTI